jgi:3-oxoacyl-[acyl-carrier protein] reductase
VPTLDHFVANAGTGHVTPFPDLDDDEFDRVVSLNFTGTIHCMQSAARLMARNSGVDRSIVVVSSIRAVGAVPGSRAGVNQAARVAAAELAPRGIRVNILSPGITETPCPLPIPDPSPRL